MAVERKKSKNETKKSELGSNNNKTNSTNNISENESILNISEFNIGNDNVNNSAQNKKENNYKDEFISKITEINIKIDKDNIPLNHHFHIHLIRKIYPQIFVLFPSKKD